MGHPRPLFHLFPSSQTNITILTTNICGKMLCPSSNRRWDSNPRPLEHKYPSITTRPGLPPLAVLLCKWYKEAVTARSFPGLNSNLLTKRDDGLIKAICLYSLKLIFTLLHKLEKYTYPHTYIRLYFFQRRQAGR